ncbi:biliverdin-producing heme oxygenase [Hydrocarboniphaga sp.]|uniref:biliverdin-producing heme oxygenase n=1 Tax=Hydrocarboniphaga sp. TaxID=2033016 RepID=UPI003D111290
MTALFARLRAETALDHGRLERQLDLMSDSLTASRYRQVLQAFYGYVEAYEQQLLRDAPKNLSALIAPRLRASMLRQDLLALGLNTNEIDALPRAGDLPATDTLPSLFGCLYVMEGSTLGGRIIGPRLERQLGLHDGLGYSYFLGHGADTGRMWSAFREAMDQALGDARHDEAVAAAGAMFRSLTQWFASLAQAHEPAQAA